MAIVTYAYYSTTYMGQEADQASFPAFEARAEDIVCAMTRWQVSEETIADLPAFVQTLVKKAICAQADFFAINGLDSAAGNDGRGFTVGKVTVQGKAAEGMVRSGALSGNVSPLALMYLEQTGLMNPAVPVVGGMPC